MNVIELRLLRMFVQYASIKKILCTDNKVSIHCFHSWITGGTTGDEDLRTLLLAPSAANVVTVHE